MINRVIIGLCVGGLVGFASPCDPCGEDVLCLGQCAYTALVEAKSQDALHEASLLLAHSWLRGDFVEGVPRLLYPVIAKRGEKDSLRLHALLLLAQAHYKLGRIDSAVILYEWVSGMEAYPFLRARAYLGVAGILAGQDLLRAFGYAAQAAEIADRLSHPLLTAVTYIQLAYLTAEQRNLSTALRYGEKALESARKAYEENHRHWLLEPASTVYLASIANLAALYAESGRLREAENLYQQVLQQARQDTVAFGQALIGLAALKLQKRAYSETEKLLNTYQSLIQRLPHDLRREALRLQAQLYIAQNRLTGALSAYERLIEETEAQVRLGQSTRIQQLRLLSGIEHQEARLQSLEAERQRERTFYFILGGLGLLTLGGMGLAVRSARRRAAEERSFREVIASQAKKIEEQAQALERQNEELIRISETLAEALASVQESHNAARRLQRAILPDLEQRLPSTAVYYQPMHEVGGDFYGLVSDPGSQRMLFFIGDATGHGVSGAILAGILSSTTQNLFLREPLQSPSKLLRSLLTAMSTILRQEETLDGKPVREGADLAIGIADFRSQKLYFGLAARPVWLLTKEGLKILDGGRRGIDSYTPADYDFPMYEEPLDSQLTLFLFTDGITDTLNPQGKKLGTKAFRSILEAEGVCTTTCIELKEKLIRLIMDWRDNAHPNDDATFILLPIAALYAYAEKRFALQT